MSLFGNKRRKIIVALNRASIRLHGHSLEGTRSLYFNWRIIEKLTSVTLLKLMASYIAITATATKSIDILEHWGVDEIKLPFSWQVLFWGAFIYAIGYVIYLWKCPPFIKEHPDFRTVRSSSMIIEDYVYELEIIKNSGIPLIGFEEEHQQIINCLSKGTPIEDGDNDCLSAINKYAVSSRGENRGEIEKSKELYNIISHALSASDKPFAITSSALIYAAFLILLYIVLSNVFIAISYLLIG